MAGTAEHKNSGSTFAPLREPTFRRVWTASLLSNFGQLILGVGAAWEMTRLTSSPTMVALVQTALMLPLMLVAVPAGAIADMLDRRKIAITGLAISIICAALLTALAYMELTTPWVLLAFCSLIGVGVAIYVPAWQSSVGEQVSAKNLPSAIALGSISYNLARSFGPAIGGLVVLAAGAQAAFAINAFCYAPLLLVYFFWKRQQVPSRLPPERIDRAIVSGARYAMHSQAIRKVLGRSFVIALAGATAGALAPLLAKDLLGGNASTYGLLLGAGGVGAVGGAMLVGRVTAKFRAETAIRCMSIFSGIMLAALGFSHNLILSCLLFAAASASSIMTISMLNVSVQLSAPRWVTARALSLFSASLTGGIAIGSVMWGAVAQGWGVTAAMVASGIALGLTPLFGLLSPLPEAADAKVETVELNSEPDVALGLTLRSGPISIAIDYRVDPEQARDFYDAMRAVQAARLRNGGFNWSIARDIADPTSWTERYHCPTWGDYLRMRNRFTQADRDAQAFADSFCSALPKVIRRRLERPFGSVRWRADSPDLKQSNVGFIGP